MEDKVAVSVIIPTFNGEHKILNVLRALEKQSFKNFEVIVVIDGSVDNTAALLKKQSFGFSSFHVIEQNNQGRGKVRNNGAKAAKGNLLIFFDDDMRPIEDCVLKHIQHHERFKGSLISGGLGEEKILCKTDIQLYKAYLSATWSKPLAKLKDAPLDRQNIFLTAANFSAPKELFFELGGFDESLTDIEDYDLALRAFNHRTPLFCDPAIFSWHDDPITCASYIKRKRQYYKVLAELRKSKPGLYEIFTLKNFIQPKGIKAIIFKLFTFRFWVWSVDNTNWLKLFPRALRYKIYGLIITANGVFYPESLKL